jgi:hypothetical protein
MAAVLMGGPMREHEVLSGECLTAVAVANGFTDRQKLLDDAANAELKRERPNPNVLRPGDRVAIPAHDPGTEGCATGRSHRLVIALPTMELRVVLRSHDGTALANAPYTMELDRELRAGTTDGDGRLTEVVRITQRTASLEVEGQHFVLKLSTLAPVGGRDDDIEGVQARLHNLGYDVGPFDGIYGRRTRAALAVFQVEQGLEVTGDPDAATRSALEREHGC